MVAALDVGGTDTKSALVSSSLEVLVESVRPTPRGLGGTLGSVAAEIIADLRQQARDRGAEVDVVGCGIVVPGVVDEAAQVARWSVNLGWRDLEAADLVAQATGLPTVLGHDVRAALHAEIQTGAGREAHDVLLVAIGTGIACAARIDGHILEAGGRSGELGHVVVDPQGPVCACGNRGCLEAIASAAAVARAYADRTGTWVDARTVAGRVGADDPVADQVWNEATTALARGIAGAVALTGADLVLIGGGLAESGETLLAPLRAAVPDTLRFRPGPRIERAALGSRAACLGAAYLAWRHVAAR